ncbi:M48 family metalloprotease [bacterium]|nr:M48 family metalloprotease [bacterium]
MTSSPVRVGAAFLLGISVAGVVTGCSPSPPQALVQVQVKSPPSQTWISTADEVELGKQVSQAVEKEMPLWHNPQAQQRLNKIGQRLAQTSTRHDLEYRFKLLDSDLVNAMAVPGGTMYATRALMEKFPDDDQLAFVLGHELAHVEQRHSISKLTQTMLRRVLTLPLQFRSWPISRAALQAGDQLIGNRFSQAAESEADRLGQQHLIQIGIDPHKAVDAMERLRSVQAGHDIPLKLEQIFSDHPPTQQRVDALRQGATASPKPTR